MDCPYCSGTVLDRALACRHCGTDLRLVTPLLLRLAALEERVAALTPPNAPVSDTVEPAALTAFKPGVPSLPSAPAWPQVLAKAGLGVVVALAALVGVHAIAVFAFDLPVIWLRLACVALPFAIGAKAALSGGRVGVVAHAGLGLALGAAAVHAMSAAVARVDHTPVLPVTARDWREAAEFTLSIAAGWLAGTLAAHHVAAPGVQASGTSGPAGWGQRVESANSFGTTLAAMVATVVSVVSGVRSLIP